MKKEVFKVVILGCLGGPRETNLSGYLLYSLKHEEAIVLDAGTLLKGIEVAIEKGNFGVTNPAVVLQDYVKAYLISHAHLDHVAGLIINSQIDYPKYILGMDRTIDYLRDHLFNGKIWPNYGNEGKGFLSRYQYVRLKVGEMIPIPHTQEMRVEPFILSHPGDYLSSAFLVEESGTYVLYFGDTSSDKSEKEKRLALVWTRVAPLIRQKALRAIFLECSFAKKNKEFSGYGHLTTETLIEELEHLESIAETSLKGFKVIVTHIKEDFSTLSDAREEIRGELESRNKMGVDFIFPTQGEAIYL